tara:strand:+ start:27 stop:314 length:288 start_codon:yes stop_codon:yes gene_type:complete
MTRYRNSTRIVCDLLTVTQNSGQDGIAVTKLCHKSNLAYGRLQTFIKRLTSSGLVNKIEHDSRSKNTFVITEKGSLFLTEYKKFNELASDFGLEM